jgi:TonB family protein
MIRTIAPYIVTLTLLSASSGVSFEPARFESGDLFVQSAMTIGGGEVLLELDVDANGYVTKVTTLRATPPFAELLSEAARGWKFTPAREVPEESEALTPTASKVLVAGLFRPPTTYDAPARGEVAEDVVAPSPDVAFPRKLVAPPYPPTASWHIGQMVLLEADVGKDGSVTSTRVIRSAAGLDAAATDAVSRWQFRPAHRGGSAIRSFVYVVIGFREPVISMRD